MGRFFVIEEAQAQKFTNIYFNGVGKNHLKIFNKVSPKILIVAPRKRLSWQYHNRRSEVWQVVRGEVSVKLSNTDKEGIAKTLYPADFIEIKQGERHRLIGLDTWGIVAEIWQHTENGNPSDEDDIIRVQDDFGR